MKERTFCVGEHEFRFSAVRAAEAGWTTVIVHINHGIFPVAERRFHGDSVYPTEDDAFDYAQEIAHEMARHIE